MSTTTGSVPPNGTQSKSPRVLKFKVAAAPCDSCRFARRCAAQLLACEAFAIYVEGDRWQAARRVPSRPLPNEGQVPLDPETVTAQVAA
jgi:hypothetical protein